MHSSHRRRWLLFHFISLLSLLNGVFCCSFKCDNGTKCLKELNICNGRQDCRDGSDEIIGCDPERLCPPGWAKCADGGQCAPLGSFCRKRGVVGSRQYDCRDKSDESVWGCESVKGRNCSRSEKLWKCSEMCVELKKVCDGRYGLYTNNCPDGEDEDEQMCKGHECDDGYLKCANGVRCVHVKGLCNGRAECQDSSDEGRLRVRLRIKGRRFDFTSDCRREMSPCLTKGFAEGLRCGKSGFCVEAGKICDGICDCQTQGCQDENVEFCKRAKCVEGYFKCKMSGRCLHRSLLCDGKYDCPFADPSDESDCECSPNDSSRVAFGSTYLRPLLVPIIKSRRK